MFKWRAFQGEGTATTNVFVPAANFQGTESLTATISDGSTAAAVLTITPVWASGQTAGNYTKVTCTLTAANLAALAPGFYLVMIAIASGGAALAEGLLQVFSGTSQSPVLDSFASPAQVIGLVPEVASQPDKIAALPMLLTAATTMIRRWLMDRDVTQRDYTADFSVALDGSIRLSQIPVNKIYWVKSQAEDALTVSNSAAQFAEVVFTTTGDVAAGQTVTGLTLNWTTNGIPGTSAVAYTANMTVSALVTAVNAVGSGWTALAGTGYGSWAVTELFGGLIGQGARGGKAAVLQVYASVSTEAKFHPDDGQKTGIVYVGQQDSQFANRWGSYPMFDDAPSSNLGLVRVSWNAGFATIPAIIQLACVETVKAYLVRMRINPYLSSETAGQRSYTMRNMLMGLPDYILQELASYRITNA